MLAGDGGDLAVLRRIVDRLPVDAYGQIYVEVGSAAQLEYWNVPAGMALQWLCRDEADGYFGAGAPHGELLARAVRGWVSEWIPESEKAHELPYVLWIGCAASGHVDRLYRELATSMEHLHLHHSHE